MQLNKMQTIKVLKQTMYSLSPFKNALMTTEEINYFLASQLYLFLLSLCFNGSSTALSLKYPTNYQLEKERYILHLIPVAG